MQNVRDRRRRNNKTGYIYELRTSMLILFPIYYIPQIKDDSKTCSNFGEDEEFIQDFTRERTLALIG
jgi:hypothetical protein